MDLQGQIIQYLATGLTLGSIYAMVGLGFTIIYNATGIINLAQGEFVMFGGLIMVFLQPRSAFRYFCHSSSHWR